MGENAQESAAQAAARLAAIVESSQDAIISKTLDGVIETWNGGAEAMFGYTAQEAVGKPFAMLIPADCEEEERQIMEQLRRGESIAHYETVRVAKDGRVFPVSLSISPIRDAGGKVIGAAKVIRDITLRRNIEEAKQRQARFDALITGILTRFASCTGSCIDEEINESLREIGLFIGAEAAFVVLVARDLAAWRWAYEAIAPGFAPTPEEDKTVPMGQLPWFEQCLLAGETVQVEKPADLPPAASLERAFYEKRGVQSALLLPLRGRGESVSGCVGLRTFSRPLAWSQEDVRQLRIVADAIANVLERRRVENDLVDSRRMLQLVLDTIPQRVFWKDKDSRFLGCNRSFAADTGHADTRDVVGKTDFAFSWKEVADRYRADDREVITSGITKIGYEEPQVRPDGSLSWLRTSKVPLRDHENRIFGVLGTYEDITAFRRAREEAQRAKEIAEAANQAKDQFIAVLSHELRTPLTPVLATVSAMEELGSLPPEMRADIEAIHRNVELEARLIDDLLDVTRISQNKLILRRENVDVHACLQSVLAICNGDIQAKRLQLSLHLDAALHTVRADPARLRQVFWNLIKNAVKFTPPEGHIDIRTASAGGRLEVEVADTGIGIEPETLARIFNAFEQGERTATRRFGGLGLGLSIAKALVEMHEGTLTARSSGKGRGSAFTVSLALAAPDAAPVAEVPTPHPGEGESRSILLVEDHVDTLQILARLLLRWGYRVTTAACVRDALARAAEQSFDLLISDIGLPDGNGCEVIGGMRAASALPAIALSGYGTDEDIRSSLAAGFTEHLTKPVSFQSLRAAVERLLKAES
ncbi:MAG: PAS domain S-box protein [Chthoniobacteraceae bacterium]|nr:PAS domain S-box protein [Chthoniobacteraceae bacterium]